MDGKGGLLGVAALACLLTVSAADTASAGGGTSKSDSTESTGGTAPTPPTFSGTKEMPQPCTFSIGLSSTDADGDLSGYLKKSGTLPYQYKLSGSTIAGPQTCEVNTWTSSWAAVDDGGNESGTSSLTLKCTKRIPDSAPSTPEYWGNLTQSEPCAFNVTLHSTAPNGRQVSFVPVSPSSCLPPNHTFNGWAIVPQAGSGQGQWTCAFKAVNNFCEESAVSSVTMTCGSAAGTRCDSYLPSDQNAFCQCCVPRRSGMSKGSITALPPGCEMFSSYCL